MEVVSMDAIGLSNYAAMNGIKPQAKPSNSAPVAGVSTPATSLEKPIVDTVEISSTTPQQAPQKAVFDPTATNGTYAQKHVCGELATSSAIDGYDGWAAMLRHCFGMTENLDRTDIPVIPRFSSLDRSVDGYGLAAGYIPANALTNEQRNLIANLFVYAHDHGMSEDGAVHSLASAMVDIATRGSWSTGLQEYDEVSSLAQQAADTREDIHGVSNRDYLVDSVRRYGFTTRNNSARDDAEALQRDEVALRKVDALANAFAANNTLSILFTPGKDKDGKPTTNLLDMMRIDPENKEKPQVQAEILTKKYNDALAAIQNKLFKPPSPAKPGTKPGVKPPTQG